MGAKSKCGIPLKTHGIYMIKNRINNKFYVGSAVCLANRWAKHRMDMNRGISGCKRIQSAWTCYGEDCFEFIVLEKVKEKADLIKREQFYIDTLIPEYNILRKAGSMLGYKPSDETKKKQGDSRRGEKNVWFGVTGEGHPQFGRKHSEESKARLSALRAGKNNPMFGVRTKQAKLSDDEALDVKLMLASGRSCREIKDAYPQLNKNNISMIRTGRAYGGIKIE